MNIEQKTRIINELSTFTGTVDFFKYRTPFAEFLYTDGVNYLVATCKACWMLDIVASYQHSPKVMGEEFQVYKFEVNDSKATLIIEDGNGKVLATQKIEYTDFPLESITIWFSGGVVLLPTEY